jgi:hypothetical protein
MLGVADIRHDAADCSDLIVEIKEETAYVPRDPRRRISAETNFILPGFGFLEILRDDGGAPRWNRLSKNLRAI